MEDPVSLETKRLAYFAVFHVLNRSTSNSGGSGGAGSEVGQSEGFFGKYETKTNTEICLQACVLKILERHAIVFNSMMKRLNIDRSVDFKQGFYEIALELFKDVVSWSKIVALFAFGARVGQYCRDNDLSEIVEDIAFNLADFANQRITPFVREEGGWATLCKVFPQDENYENKIWRGLLIVGIGLTLLTLVVLSRK